MSQITFDYPQTGVRKSYYIKVGSISLPSALPHAATIVAKKAHKVKRGLLQNGGCSHHILWMSLGGFTQLEFSCSAHLVTLRAHQSQPEGDPSRFSSLGCQPLAERACA